MKQEVFPFFSRIGSVVKRVVIRVIGIVLASMALVEAQPTNDNFSTRTILSGTEVSLSGSLNGATSEPGEPSLSGISSGQTAWWTWTAPSNGLATLDWILGTGFQPLVTVYAGEDLAGLSLVASNNFVACYGTTNCGCHWRVRDFLTFHVTAGQAYQIAVDSPIMTDAQWRSFAAGPVMTNYVAPGAPLSMDLFLSPSPPNDNFEQRIMLSGSRTQIYADNFGAGKQVGEPNHLSNPGGSSVWYSWTAPASGRVTISANEIPPYGPPTGGVITTMPVLPGPCGRLIEATPLPIFFPVFAVYTGSSLDSLASANALPMGLDAYPHGVEFDAIKGQTYQIAFDGNMGTEGMTPLYLALIKPAVNDSFGRRIQLHGAYAMAKGYNAGATHQRGAPVVGNSIGKTVWWSWRAPVNGQVTIDLTGSDYPFPTAVYTGTTLASLRQVAMSTGGVTFRGVEGNNYQIAISDAGGLTGLIKMRLQAPIADANLIQVLGSGQMAVLKYGASNGQILLLMRSSDGSHWQNVTTGTAHGNGVSFVVRPPPGASGPFYRAIVIDRAF